MVLNRSFAWFLPPETTSQAPTGSSRPPNLGDWLNTEKSGDRNSNSTRRGSEYHSNFGERLYTPWKINMEPENDGLEDDFPFQLGGF